jgi:hypothetical protein
MKLQLEMKMRLESTKEESQQGQYFDNDGGDRAEEGSRTAGVILQ